MSDTKCEYCDSWNGGHTMACSARYMGKQKPRQIPVSRRVPASGDVIDEVLSEVGRATKKFPTWPTRALDAVGVLNEEVGELNKEILQMTYEPHKTDKSKVRAEAIQAAAMAIRFLMSLEKYDYSPAEQHKQELL